jgi:hypothetical protein
MAHADSPRSAGHDRIVRGEFRKTPVPYPSVQKKGERKMSMNIGSIVVAFVQSDLEGSKISKMPK